MASTRLRKTFRYPESEDEDDRRADIDEQEQEALIQKLRQRHEAENFRFKIMFTVLPCICSLVFIPRLLSSSIIHQFLSCLSVVSLLYAAWTMYQGPAEGKQPRSGGVVQESLQSKYLPWCHFGLCLFLAIAGYRVGDETIHGQYYYIPAVMSLIIFTAQKIMLSVDVGELESLRYGYKGA